MYGFGVQFVVLWFRGFRFVCVCGGTSVPLQHGLNLNLVNSVLILWWIGFLFCDLCYFCLAPFCVGTKQGRAYPPNV